MPKITPRRVLDRARRAALDASELVRRGPSGPLIRSPRAPGEKPRVLFFLLNYPTFSETYMHEEIRALRDDFDIRIISCLVSPAPRRDAWPYEVIENKHAQYDPSEMTDIPMRTHESKEFLRRAGAVIEEFQPDAMHAHYVTLAPLLRRLAETYHVPFTIRAHSQDNLGEPREDLSRCCQATDTPWCERVLTMPFSTERLIDHGVPRDKVAETWPVVRFSRFHRPEKREPTGRIMCAGPSIPKKAHDEFVDLARSMEGSGLHFDLYGVGYGLDRYTRPHNEQAGNPVALLYADPEDMHEVYPQYDWLVYPASRDEPKVGMPVAIAEAMAMGLGVCWQSLPGREDDQRLFLGGAGYLFRSIDEVPAIITQPYPEEKRQAGFEAARRCDIESTKHLLSEVWAKRPSALPAG